MSFFLSVGIRQTNAKRQERRAKTTLVLGGHSSPCPSPANNNHDNNSGNNIRPVSSTVSAINSHSQVVRVATTGGRNASPVPSAAAVNAR